MDDDALIAAVRERHAGVGIAELVAQFGGSRRGLQKHLQRLVAAGLVEVVGRGRATRYVASRGAGELDVLALDPDAIVARDYLRRPPQHRAPVGYIRSFLDDYQPGRTWYLPEALRSRLAEIGRREARTRPAGTYARAILERLIIDLSWASSKLEGNTYSLLDTQRLLAGDLSGTGHDAHETQMILNHKAAIEMLVVGAGENRFDPYTFRNLHALLADNLMGDPSAAGRLRRVPVEIGGSTYVPTAIPSVIEECFRTILDKADAIGDPFEQAFFVMVHIPYLQPFLDVNKRVSRLAANIPFIERNFAPLSFVGVPERAYVEATLAVYELRHVGLLRELFAWAYERSASRYAVIKDSIVQPDRDKLLYRQQIRAVVAAIVRERLPAQPEVVEARVPEDVAEGDRRRFVEIIIEELLDLHEGSVMRFGLRASDLEAWDRRG